MNTSTRFATLLVLLFTFLTGCGPNADNPLDGGNTALPVVTTVAGIISYGQNDIAPRADIVVSVGNRTVTADEHGFFVIPDVEVPGNRCAITVKREGCFPVVRLAEPKAGGVTRIEVWLPPINDEREFDASEGEEISFLAPRSMTISPMSFIDDKGQLYNGKVKYDIHMADPQYIEWASDNMAGDPIGRRTNGEEAELYAYGVARMKFMTPWGKELSLAPGKKAVVKFPVNPIMAAGFPAELPMWYFDEVQAVWREEGKAVKQGDLYVAEISHIDDWMCAVATGVAYVQGRVMSLQEGFPGNTHTVSVGQRDAVVDENGFYRCRVPADIPIRIFISSSATEEIVRLNAGETATVDLHMFSSTGYIEGSLIDCDGNPAKGVVLVDDGDGGYAVVQKDGRYKIAVPYDLGLRIKAVDFDGTAGDMRTVDMRESQTIVLDPIKLCSQNSAFVNFSVEPNSTCLALSTDGYLLAVGGRQGVAIYNAQTKALLKKLPWENVSSVAFNRQGTLLMAASRTANAATTRIWKTDGWQENATLSNMESPMFTWDGLEVIAIEHSTRHLLTWSALSPTENPRSHALPEPISMLIGTRGDQLSKQYIYITAGASQKVVIRDVYVNTFEHEFQLPAGMVPLSAQLADDGEHYYIATSDSLFIYTPFLSNGRSIDVGHNNTSARVFSPDGEHFAWQYSTFTKDLGLFTSYNVHQHYFPLPAANAQCSFLTFSHNGLYLAGLWGDGNKVCVWKMP